MDVHFGHNRCGNQVISLFSVSNKPGPLLPPPAWPLTAPSSGVKEAKHPSAGDNRQVRPHIDPEEKSLPKCLFCQVT